MRYDKPSSGDFVHYLLRNLDIPKNKILFLHVKLHNIQEITKKSYKNLTKSLIDSLLELYQPKTILVPSFTYSFTKSGIFHRLFSKSEVGRFSEEVRTSYSEYRTPDPIFSVLDIKNHLQKNINYNTAFGKNSLFQYLTDENYITINFDLEELVSTGIHYIEKMFEVSYRYDKIFKGVVYYNENHWEHVKYIYFVRNLANDPNWNRPKIEQFLSDTGGLHLFVNDGIKISWISARATIKGLTLKLLEDETYLIT